MGTCIIDMLSYIRRIYIHMYVYMYTKPNKQYSYMYYYLIRNVAENRQTKNDIRHPYFFLNITVTSLTSLSFVCFHVCMFDGSHFCLEAERGIQLNMILCSKFHLLEEHPSMFHFWWTPHLVVDPNIGPSPFRFSFTSHMNEVFHLLWDTWLRRF